MIFLRICGKSYCHFCFIFILTVVTSTNCCNSQILLALNRVDIPAAKVAMERYSVGEIHDLASRGMCIDGLPVPSSVRPSGTDDVSSLSPFVDRVRAELTGRFMLLHHMAKGLTELLTTSHR